MATGFRRSDGADLDQLFMAGGTGVAGYPFTFQAYTVGSKQPATGYRRSDGVDLADLFQHIGVPLGSMVNPLGYNGKTYTDWQEEAFMGAQVTARHHPDGTWELLGNYTGQWETGNWWSNPVAGVGNNKYIRWWRVATHYNFNGYFAPDSGWVLLDAARGPYVSAAGSSYNSARADATYQIELSSDGGTVHSAQQVRMSAGSPKWSGYLI